MEFNLHYFDTNILYKSGVNVFDFLFADKKRKIGQVLKDRFFAMQPAEPPFPKFL